MFAALHKMQGIGGALLLSVKMCLSVSFFPLPGQYYYMQCLIYLQ